MIALRAFALVVALAAVPPAVAASALLADRDYADAKAHMFDVLGTAVAPYRQIVESRGHPGRYYAWIVHFRDANEVLEAMYEFERTGDSYRPARIGHLDTRCP